MVSPQLCVVVIPSGPYTPETPVWTDLVSESSFSVCTENVPILDYSVDNGSVFSRLIVHVIENNYMLALASQVVELNRQNLANSRSLWKIIDMGRFVKERFARQGFQVGQQKLNPLFRYPAGDPSGVPVLQNKVDARRGTARHSTHHCFADNNINSFFSFGHEPRSFATFKRFYLPSGDFQLLDGLTMLFVAVYAVPDEDCDQRDSFQPNGHTFMFAQPNVKTNANYESHQQPETYRHDFPALHGAMLSRALLA
jgi:hypothetical protein